MRLVSWNIQGGKNLDAVAEVLAHLNPDIVTLQEVKEQDGANSAEILAKKLNCEYRFFPAFTTERHIPSYTIGNGILSRPKIVSSRDVFLSTLNDYEGSSATEPRNAGVTDVKLPGGTLLRVVSSHLAYSENFERSKPRDRQVEKLLNEITSGAATIVGLDLNSEPSSSALEALTARVFNTDSSSEYTWTNAKVSALKRYRIDYILRSSDIKQIGFEIFDTDASDHRPLVLDFEI